MTQRDGGADDGDRAPGDKPEVDGELGTGAIHSFVVGLTLSTLLTVASFGLPATGLVWGPGVPVALAVFAIAQMGVHLVFFLHITTAPDNTNNVLALAFGVLIVGLLIAGSLFIMTNLNYNMLPMHETAPIQRSRAKLPAGPQATYLRDAGATRPRDLHEISSPQAHNSGVLR